MVLLDIEMFNMLGIELVEILSKCYFDIKIMIIIIFLKVGYIKCVMKVDVCVFILKEVLLEYLINVIKLVN